MRCPLDSCNTGAHVFKKPGPGDIPRACRWLSFPSSHRPPQEGCKFGRSCIISRPSLSHFSPATSLSVTPFCWPHSLPPPHLPLLLPAAHPDGFLDRPRTLSWHGHALEMGWCIALHAHCTRAQSDVNGRGVYMGMSLHKAWVSGGSYNAGIVASHGHAWGWDPLRPLCWGILVSLPAIMET